MRVAAVLIAILVVVRSTLAASAVSAAPLPCIPPSEGQTVPDRIVLVGSAGGLPARSFGEFEVIVRCLGSPLPGARVRIDFSACPDLRFCADQQDRDMTVECGAGYVSKLTDANGSVRMTILGGSNGAGHAWELHNAGRIYANGALIGSPTVSALDLDGILGLGAGDLSAFLGDFASGQPYGRCDFDGNGSTGSGDLSIWLGAFASGAMIESCGASCP